jgi:putative spermidine/putrescine transport system permease protein
MSVLRGWVLPVLFVGVIAFFLLPLLTIVVISFTPGAYFRFPIEGFSWRWYETVLTDTRWLAGFVASFLLAIFVAVTTSLASAMAVIALHGKRRTGLRHFLGIVAGLPLLLPHVSIGIAFLAAAPVLGLAGSYIIIAIAHCVLAIPFAYRPILSSFDSLDPSLFNAAAALGARPGFSFWHVQLPALRPGIVVAAIFTFALSFDEITVTMFLVGPGITTLPLRVLAELQEAATPAVAAASTLIILMTIACLGLIERVSGLTIFADVERSR